MTYDRAATPGGGQDQPEYELTDPDERQGQEPEYELSSDDPPPPDDPVIRRAQALLHARQSTWVLVTFIGILVVVVAADIGFSAFLPPKHWTQAKPEIDDIRNTMFPILLVVIGYFFGERDRRHR
jgi:hypothetical protein